MNECFFVSFSRLLTKDQIKKGTFSITLGTGSYGNPFADAGASVKVLTDASASSTGGTLNTLGGDYGLLFTTDNVARGLVFYESGVAILSTSSFDGMPAFFSSSAKTPGFEDVADVFVTSSITGAADILRHRIQNISFNNTTEINSTIYYCRVPSNDFNHSSNPTYLSSSTIRVKDVASDPPISYITTVGLYASEGELLAMAKLSEPLRKDPTNELTLRVRLDY